MTDADRDDVAFAELFRAAAAPVPDDGFTSRVLAALPPPAAARLDVRFFVWSLAGAVLGAAVALANNVTSGLQALAQPLLPMFLHTVNRFDPWIVFALLLTTFCAALTAWALRHRTLFV